MFMDNERHVCCPVEFNKALIGKEFMYFDVEGEPFAKQRPRATRKGRFITVYTPRETKLYEAKVLRAYQKIYKNKQLDGDLTVNIEGIFSVPKSVSSKKAKKMIKDLVLPKIMKKGDTLVASESIIANDSAKVAGTVDMIKTDEGKII